MNSLESMDSTSTCLKACKSDELCNFYSYHKERKVCVLLKECQALEESQKGYESGQSECPIPSPNGKPWTTGSGWRSCLKKFKMPFFSRYQKFLPLITPMYLKPWRIFFQNFLLPNVIAREVQIFFLHTIRCN